MPVRKWMRLPGNSHLTLFLWGAMALPFVLAITGLFLAVRMLGERGSTTLVTETATLTLIFVLGVVAALLVTWLHSR